MHGRKNWFIGVYEIPEICELKFNESDIDFQAVRSSGAGGQHVNKVSSAIRATHRATGISVFSQESRSQQQNKKIAIERLKEKIALENTEIQLKMIAQKWMQHKSLERGNAVKVFQN
jgi:peptide chain release factor